MTRTLTLLAGGIAVIVTSAACSRSAPTRSTIVTPLLGTGQVSTSRHDLARTIATTREKVAKAPDDVPAAVMLADALLRETRVLGNAGLAKEAERVLLDVLKRDTERYDARRMLGVCGLGGFSYCRASDVPLENPKHSRKTRSSRVQIDCRIVRRDTRLYLPLTRGRRARR